MITDVSFGVCVDCSGRILSRMLVVTGLVLVLDGGPPGQNPENFRSFAESLLIDVQDQYPPF
ncbi:MAG: hypothetical protein RIK87_04945 [Fuerstiella sp.]